MKISSCNFFLCANCLYDLMFLFFLQFHCLKINLKYRNLLNRLSIKNGKRPVSHPYTSRLFLTVIFYRFSTKKTRKFVLPPIHFCSLPERYTWYRWPRYLRAQSYCYPHRFLRVRCSRWCHRAVPRQGLHHIQRFWVRWRNGVRKLQSLHRRT